MCFGLDWLLHVVIALIVIGFVVTNLKIWVIPILAADARIVATINAIIWVLVAIFVVVVCFQLLECALGGGFGPLLPRTGPRG
jgi:hypothetical protein